MITWVNCCKRIGHFWNDVTNQFFFLCAGLPLVLEVKCFTSDKHPSFVIQVTTSRLASACLDELRAFCILHNVFALQAEVIIKTLREHIGPTTNIMKEVTGSLDGMYYWAKVPHVRSNQTQSFKWLKGTCTTEASNHLHEGALFKSSLSTRR